MADQNMTKIDLGDIDPTISNNSLAGYSSPETIVRTTPHIPDPVKPKSFLRGSRLVLLITAVALSALLAGAIAATLAIYKFDVLNATPQRVFINSSYVDDAEDKLEDDVNIIDPMEPKVFRVDAKSAGNTKANEPIRLVNGNSPNEGRVEIFYNGRWGTICDDYFDLDAAHVVCRQLGYEEALAYHPWAWFGEGSGRIWLDNVQCWGYEADIDYCHHRPWGRHNCQHYEDVGVTCKPNTPTEPTEVRLVGGYDANQGRVEVKHNGQWGTVCDDSWTNEDAKVVCRQLGLPYQNAIALSNAHFGEGVGDILLDEVHCTGNEENIGDCQHQAWGSHDCSHYEDASVICTDGNDPFEIRLVGGATPNEGRVEVRRNGIWGTVCDDSWDDLDANVVCRQLGYTGTGHQGLSFAYFGQGSGPIFMDEVSCFGSETSLDACIFGGWNYHDCSHYEDAGVRCMADNTAPDTTPPIISCPLNQPTFGVISAPAGGSAFVNFPDATATDRNDYGQESPVAPTISYSVQFLPLTDSSWYFPIGTTSVTATAVDANNNDASCTFTVTVTESNEPPQPTQAPPSGPWEELANQCGRPNVNFNNRIVNGNDVTDLRMWPWAGFMTNDYFCGAELISRNWAITAAHCVHGVGATTSVTFGKLNRYENIQGVTHTSTVQVIEHPNYDEYTTNNDIALLKLNNPVPGFNDYVKPVCMATTADEYIEYDRDTCYVIGWGALQQGGASPDILQEVQSPLILQSDCRDDYRGYTITDQMICTSTESNSGSCQGDSGGPMVCKHRASGLWDLVGVTSWGVGCANPNYPDVMARVSQFQTWIRSTVDANGGP